MSDNNRNFHDDLAKIVDKINTEDKFKADVMRMFYDFDASDAERAVYKTNVGDYEVYMTFVRPSGQGGEA